MSNIPKRTEERRRRNKTTDAGYSNEVESVVVDPAALEDTSLVAAPAPNPDWHWLAKMQYEAAKRSAIRDFYEPTDWAQLFVLCETLSTHMSDRQVYNKEAGEFEWVGPEPMNGATLGAILKGFSNLMFDEGTRRKLRIEVTRVVGSAQPQAQPPGVTDIRTKRLSS